MAGRLVDLSCFIFSLISIFFRGLRLDWTRLQSYLSTGGSKSVKLDEFKATGGAGILNTVVFHTRMVDQLEAVLVETSDLSIFCFYARLFEDYFQMCLEFPAQNRYTCSAVSSGISIVAKEEHPLKCKDL